MKEWLIRQKQYLLSGVSYAIPFVACGGILIALAITFAPMGEHGPDFSQTPYLKKMLEIGVASFTLLVPILSGYIAYGMVNRPGLVPGMVGGWIATHLGTTMVDGVPKDVSAGFLGGIVAGLFAGWVVMQLKKLNPPAMIRPVMPILVIPVLGSLIVGAVMFVVGIPISDAMTAMADWLKALSGGNKIVLAMILGAMIAFDMGGPVNKVAFFFSAAMIEKGICGPMGACAAAICVPPLGLGLATVLARRLWTEQERESGYAALAMGAIGITEGAIPFAAADPFRVIPVIMVGSMVGAVGAMLFGVADHAPHGGLIVLPVITAAADPVRGALVAKLLYVVSILAGVLVTAAGINFLKRNQPVADERTGT